MTAKFNPNSKPQLTQNYSPLELEKQVRDFWQKNNTQKTLADIREKNCIKKLGYVEGPPTLNGIQHVGHARGRVIKEEGFPHSKQAGRSNPFAGNPFLLSHPGTPGCFPDPSFPPFPWNFGGVDLRRRFLLDTCSRPDAFCRRR